MLKVKTVKCTENSEICKKDEKDEWDEMHFDEKIRVLMRQASC
jgi:hypothetical protein